MVPTLAHYLQAARHYLAISHSCGCRASDPGRAWPTWAKPPLPNPGFIAS